jgi:hypothetical protein
MHIVDVFAAKLSINIVDRVNHLLSDWEQPCPVHPDVGQGQPEQEEEQDTVPQHHAGRCAGNNVPNGR